MKNKNRVIAALELAGLWIAIIAIPAIGSFFTRCAHAIRNWWHEVTAPQETTDENNRNFHLFVHTHRRSFLDRLIRGISRIIWGGLVLYVGTKFFYPEFAEEFPTLYSIFHGCAQLMEFMANWMFRATQSIFNGEFIENSHSMLGEWVELWNQFVSWLMAL